MTRSSVPSTSRPRTHRAPARMPGAVRPRDGRATSERTEHMTAPAIYPSAAGLGLFRTSDNPGVWPYRGQVAAVGIGHSPTLRNCDGDPQTSVGGWAILAIRRAIEDAGVAPGDVDGLVLDSSTSTGAFWPRALPLPEDFQAPFQLGGSRIN